MCFVHLFLETIPVNILEIENILNTGSINFLPFFYFLPIWFQSYTFFLKFSTAPYLS